MKEVNVELTEGEILKAISEAKLKKKEAAEKVETEEVWEVDLDGNAVDKARNWLVNVYERLKTSKHFDLVKTVLISAVLATISYQLPNVYFFVFGKENVNASFADMVQQHSFAAFGFFVARLIVDTSLYFNEHKFYVFMKRNGNLAFDYQENLSDLNKWQQTLISTIKYCIYLYVYVSLLK